MKDREKRPLKVALIGNPNVGKSVIFGLLTGRYVSVSNYPGTTVEIAKGFASIDGHEVTVIDTPGINTLIPTSEDEEVTEYCGEYTGHEERNRERNALHDQ